MKMSIFRLRAFLTHLTLSILVASLSAAIVFWVWHPTPLAKAIGVTNIFVMMLIIDATLGPLLTLAVANEKKSKFKLNFDFTVIVFVQLAALTYGLYSIAINRPVYLAFDTIRIDVVQASDITTENLAKANTPYNRLPWGTPQWVAVHPPVNDAERNNRLMTELQTAVSPAMQPHLYQPLAIQINQICKEAAPIADLNKFNEPSTVTKQLAPYPHADKWLPVKAYNLDMVLLINSQSQEILNIVDLRPW